MFVPDVDPDQIKNPIALIAVGIIQKSVSKAKRITKRTGKAIKHWIAPNKNSFTRWLLDCIGILLTKKDEKSSGGAGGGGGSGRTSATSPRKFAAHTSWNRPENFPTSPGLIRPDGSMFEPSGSIDTMNAHSEGNMNMSEITGLKSYLASLDELGGGSGEEHLTWAQGQLAKAQAAAESKHDDGKAADLADHWSNVVSSMTDATESSDSTASAAHSQYDGAVEALEGCNAPAAQAYMGDS
jgi:hypothetical protein